MPRTKNLPIYRVLLRGEGIDNDGEWVGFFTTRQAKAVSKEAAEADVVAAFLVDWRDEVCGSMTTMRTVQPVESKQLKTAWFNRPRGGFTFFNDAQDAEDAALRIERRAGGYGS